MSFIMQLDVETLANLIVKAYEKELEDSLWEQWLAELPNMDKKSFISFESYKNKRLNTQESSTNVQDDKVLEDAENILKMMNEPK